MTKENTMVKIRLLFFAILLLHSVFAYSASKNYQLSFLSVEDGLSHNEVTSIVQDKYGFMWFGTRGGLNRYDGYVFQHYKPSVTDSNSISNPSIECLHLNLDNDIEIGLKSGGPTKYISSKEVFEKSDLARDYSISRVLSFYDDSKGNHWIGSWSNGVVCIKEDTVVHYSESGQVRQIVETDNGVIWIASSNGLKYKTAADSGFINFKGGSITALSVDRENECLWVLGWTQELMKIDYLSLKSEVFVNHQPSKVKNFSMLNDSQGKLWIGTWGNGLFLFDKQSEQYEHVDVCPSDQKSVRVDLDVVRAIYEDKVGDLWLGTQAGVVRLSPKNNFKSVSVIDNFTRFKTHISAVLQDKNGRLWVGTNGNGLFYSDDNEEFTRVDVMPVPKANTSDKMTVKAINVDGNNCIWVSLEDGIYTIGNKESAKPFLMSAETFFQREEFIMVRKVHQLFFEDNTLWVATQQSGVFLFEMIDARYKLTKHFKGSGGSGMLGDNRVTAIEKDQQGNIWFATYKGLYKYNPIDSTFLSLSDLGITSSLACDILLCLEIDKNGNVWFGTPCSLNKLEFVNSSEPVLYTYSKSNGLSDDYINGLVDGHDGRIWLSSNAGISCINPHNGQILNFDKADGIGDVSYSENACFQGTDGTIYFGGYTSITSFKPQDIRPNNYQAPLVISLFTILNEPVSVGDNNRLESNINDIQELVLSHDEMEFSLQVASLDYKAPDKNQYMYRLSGYEQDWVELGNRRTISFNNLKPDTYRLQIKGSNSNGIWGDDIRELVIKVRPAPWKSGYAIVAYVVFILIVVLIIIRTALRQERLHNSIEMERMKAKQLTDINDYKLRFFTNISHEFRTPLTLIMAPVKELLGKDFNAIKPDFFSDRINMIAQNTNRLYSLVNQLLEFRKMEAGKVTLNVSKADLAMLVKEVSMPFHQHATSQSINFRVNYAADDSLVWLDIERITIVLTNLLSNAFKYGRANGAVGLTVDDDDQFYRIDVSNDGNFIPRHDLEHLFERFYQVKGNSTIGSSGIGLQLVKVFTELHKGKITVSSVEGEPVIFSVFLKKGKDHFDTDDFTDKKSIVLDSQVMGQYAPKRSVNNGTKGATLLLVEDNTEVREYLKQFLGEHYSIVEAVDGFDGFDKAIQHRPNLVLSDVMMPRMDGYELCEKIKSNDLLSDIPVILLTAKGSDSEQLFGTQKGADLYIRKPFIPDLLLEEIKQLIATRNLLKEKYANRIVLEAEKEEISSQEAAFLTQAVKIIEKYMGDVDFTPDELAKELAMSPSTFYRHVKKALDLTPANFIKSVRIKKAQQLLTDTDLTVSEIIERVGYADSRSFRKNFKETAGVNPNEYRTNKS